MTGTLNDARRGRRENAIDNTQPAHRVAFAIRLRALRDECGHPPYRRLSELAHCSIASLSVAAAGRRLPTWETTRGYVTACLEHAGRGDDVNRDLRGWRRFWEDTQARERASRLAAPPVRRRHPWHQTVPAWAVLIVVLLLTLAAGAAGAGVL
ncbi:hypothetical protein AB0J83_08385 [Actinoplanes sp. NPDC049596]|uniref:hypothetical protein n=1 Tax=unclassified Actinoplanes TaxID=2626549 RepID=UPI003437F01B